MPEYYQSVVCIDDGIYVDGERCPDFVCSKSGNKIAQVNGSLFVNGYQLKDGEWRRTLRALYHYIF